MTLQALLFVNSEGVGTLASPRVGRFRPTIEAGHWLGSGEPFGTIEILGRQTDLVVPRTHHVFQVVEVVCDVAEPVGFKSPLLKLAPAQAGSATHIKAAGPKAAEGLPPEAISISAPTDGLFYDSPSPDDPPFIEEGSVIEVGAVVGLIEVMKFFYEIRFEAEDFKGRAKVLRVEAAKGEPIRAGGVVAWVIGVKGA